MKFISRLLRQLFQENRGKHRKSTQPATTKAANKPIIISKDQRILKLPSSGLAERSSRIKKTEKSKTLMFSPQIGVLS